MQTSITKNSLTGIRGGLLLALQLEIVSAITAYLCSKVQVRARFIHTYFDGTITEAL